MIDASRVVLMNTGCVSYILFSYCNMNFNNKPKPKPKPKGLNPMIIGGSVLVVCLIIVAVVYFMYSDDSTNKEEEEESEEEESEEEESEEEEEVTTTNKSSSVVVGSSVPPSSISGSSSVPDSSNSFPGSSSSSSVPSSSSSNSKIPISYPKILDVQKWASENDSHMNVKCESAVDTGEYIAYCYVNCAAWDSSGDSWVPSRSFLFDEDDGTVRTNFGGETTDKFKSLPSLEEWCKTDENTSVKKLTGT